MNQPHEKATRAQTKLHNSRLVFRTIYDRGPISRASIARLTRLARATVSAVVAGLLDEGLVEETGSAPSGGGKPPILLEIVDDARHLIGIDLAAGELRGAVVNLRGKVHHQDGVPVADSRGESALSLVYDLADSLVGRASRPVLGIGVGVPGLTDPDRGVVRQATLLRWQDIPLGDLLHERYQLPAYVANDCHVAALAEYAFGDRASLKNLIVVKADRTVGAGIVLHGHLFYGDQFWAGTIGHNTVIEEGSLCSCGRSGCLETVASTESIIRQAKALARDVPDSYLTQFAGNLETIDLEVIQRALDAGDEAVRQMLSEVGRYLGSAAAHASDMLGGPRIVLAGSVMDFGHVVLDAARLELRRCTLASHTDGPHAEISSLGAEIVVLGAAALAMGSVLGLF